MFSFQLLSALSSAAVLVAAAPSGHAAPAPPKPFGPSGGDDCCSTAAAVMNLPTNQTQLVSPTTAPLYVGLGVGVQNYTCSASTLKYTSTGAVASLFDISCLDKTPAFATIQTTAFNAWNAAPAGVSPNTLAAKFATPTLLGYHYFIPSPSGTGISPKWDFTSTGKNAGNSTAFVVGAKAGDITDPTGNVAANVDWLTLNNTQGALANKIFRIDTVNGQPPSSCVAGSADISVKYTAKYFLY